MKKVFKIILKILILILLTLLTQIGGIIYLVSEIIIYKKTKHHRLRKSGVFIILYFGITFLLIPIVAPIFGREKIKNNDFIAAQTIFTTVCNRNYVTPQLNKALQNIAKTLNNKHQGIKLIYLDANFPFIDGFPLLPHLSHNDGKKIDISFIYVNKESNITNKKPAILGYGVYDGPNSNEYDQIKVCKEKGYWQYDFPKYLTLGIINNELKLSKKATKDLLLAIVKEKQIRKVFIEPHLRNRIGIQSPKIRFHGCQAVRHDDHIHFQL
ncbi:hypothetical protein [Aquimarina sp. 2201CG14-23]|uniref:hypothetical protein n=1 Tax=Aquimarina mycalae TaxID=3040073 RepID=UPI002477E810|nr:hypothetical protein [Aquimarina sp. 2201CG14-23]MDH7445860.1 hypothetical protein [Aquimarina sp. 2201CG14-23]